MSVLLGAIADDFTGATDLANTLQQRGMRVVQVNGVPDAAIALDDVDAVVVALKTRTAPVRQAIDESLAALRWLQGLGVKQVFFKYCSTFDSTAEGNIGPVADALLAALHGELAVVCPAFPANHRSIYMGNLFVGNQLLHESSMKDHPLTPMRDANLVRLMAAQSRYPVGLVSWPVVSQGSSAVRAEFDRLEAAGCRYAVVDALSDDDLVTIGEAVADHSLVTGGSGVALGLPDNFRHRGLLPERGHPGVPDLDGRELVLAGSCSVRTREQIAHVIDRWPAWKVDRAALAAPVETVASIVAWLGNQAGDMPVTVYTSAGPDEVREIQQQYGANEAGAIVEDILGNVAVQAVAMGFRRIVVAGGETSGAVVQALDVRAMRIHREIDPGVPWTETLGEPGLALALKSGNFGAVDFFEKSFAILG